MRDGFEVQIFGVLLLKTRSDITHDFDFDVVNSFFLPVCHYNDLTTFSFQMFFLILFRLLQSFLFV